MRCRTSLVWILVLFISGAWGWAQAADTKPSSFELVNGTVGKGSRALPGATHSTRSVTVQGIDAPSPISISGGGRYSVNGSSDRASASTVKQGDKLVVSLRASDDYDDTVTTTLSIGGVKASFALQTVLSPSATFKSLPGTSASVYRDATPANLSIFVYKPSGWKASDLRPALVCFFGGAWTSGGPSSTTTREFGRWAASKGMVGITPDYRVNERFATTPLHSVDDARAALRWVQDHHASLGVDTDRIVTCGSSAGGHVALWTGIPRTPPGSDPGTDPLGQPAATILISAVVDTAPGTGYRPDLFGSNALALSPFHQRSAHMPPTIMFHGSADQTVPYSRAAAFCAALRDDDNVCEMVRLDGANHTWFRTKPSLQRPTYERVESFLRDLGILGG